MWRIAYGESNRGLKLFKKITDEPTPYSKIIVSLDTQVLSKSVSNILYGYYPPEAHGTAELYIIWTHFLSQCP